MLFRFAAGLALFEFNDWLWFFFYFVLSASLSCSAVLGFAAYFGSKHVPIGEMVLCCFVSFVISLLLRVFLVV